MLARERILGADAVRVRRSRGIHADADDIPIWEEMFGPGLATLEAALIWTTPGHREDGLG
jgi:hypothetical protein